MIRKVPKVSTIRKKISHYALKAGFSVHPHLDGTYSLFDIRMGYFTNERTSMDAIVRVVTDELYAIVYRNNFSVSNS